MESDETVWKKEKVEESKDVEGSTPSWVSHKLDTFHAQPVTVAITSANSFPQNQIEHDRNQSLAKSERIQHSVHIPSYSFHFTSPNSD